MATLKVVSRYSSGLGSFEPGQVLELTDEQAALLLRDSPGSFVAAGTAVRPAPPAATSTPEPDEDEDDTFDPTGAMSTETATGLTAPDRRGRGGSRR